MTWTFKLRPMTLALFIAFLGVASMAAYYETARFSAAQLVCSDLTVNDDLTIAGDVVLVGGFDIGDDLTLENDELITNATDGVVGITYDDDAVELGDFQIYSSNTSTENANYYRWSWWYEDDESYKIEGGFIDAIIDDITSPTVDVTLKFGVKTNGTLAAELALDGATLYPVSDGGLNFGKPGNAIGDIDVTGTANIDSLVADTADIDAGTFDGVVGGTSPSLGDFTTIGAGAPGSGAFTTVAASSTGIFDGQITGHTSVVTTTVTAVDVTASDDVTAEDDLIVGGAAYVDERITAYADLHTTAVYTTTLATTGTATLATVDINAGAIDNTTIGASTSSTIVATTVDATTGTFAIVDIDGGAIDGTNIGAGTPGTGAFTTLDASGAVTIAAGLTKGSACVEVLTADAVSVSSPTVTFSAANRRYVTLNSDANTTGWNVSGGTVGQVLTIISGSGSNTMQFDDATSMVIGANITLTETQSDVLTIICIGGDGTVWAGLSAHDN